MPGGSTVVLPSLNPEPGDFVEQYSYKRQDCGYDAETFSIPVPTSPHIYPNSKDQLNTFTSRQPHGVMEWVTATQLARLKSQTSGLEGCLAATGIGVGNVFQPHPSVQVVSPSDPNSPR